MVEDPKKVPGIIGGKDTMISPFASSLRKSLFQEHFGMTKEEVKDPIDPAFLKSIKELATKNTEIYREIFAPENMVSSTAPTPIFRRSFAV